MRKLYNGLFKFLAIAYFPTLFILAFIPKATEGVNIYWESLLLFFLYSVPFYFVFLEIETTIDSVFGKKAKTSGQKVLHVLRLALSVGILLTLIDTFRYIHLALYMAIAWLVLVIVGAIISRMNLPKMEKGTVKRFWIWTVVVVAVFVVAFLLLNH